MSIAAKCHKIRFFATLSPLRCDVERAFDDGKFFPTPFAPFADILNFKTSFFHCSEYFERVMLCNSVIWQCALTGRPDLTYAEALASEKTARKLLRQFPSALRGPIILVASLTKRSALKELVDDVFNFVKDRYFKDEKLDVMNESGRGCRFCKIVKIVMPDNYE